MVFVAFTQHCIQSSVSHVEGVEGVLYSVYSGLLQLPGGKAICYSTVFEKPSILGGLVVHHQSVQGGSFVNFLGLFKLQG